MVDAVRFEIARALEETGRLLRVAGESPYRARAYERAARTLEALSEDLERVVSGGRLVALPGIGESLAAHIEELHRTGRSAQLERLRASLPPGVLELSHVLTPHRIRALWKALQIETVDQLREAALRGRIRDVRGFGAKTEQQILSAIERYESRSRRALLVDALEEAAPLLEWLSGGPALRADLAGSARRWKETVGTIRVAASGDMEAVLAHAARYPRLLRASAVDGRLCARLPSGIAVEIAAVPPESHARALIVATGPAEHVERLLARSGGELPDAATEQDVYARLGLPFVPPELRDDPGVVDAALGGDTFADLLELEDVRGMVHCHTTWSDGRGTVEEMAREARSMGLGYVTITDHSPTAHYAGGVPADRLEEQWREIARAEEAAGIRVLRGTESDILADGSLDYPDDVLGRLEVVIASIHARMRMDRAAMTERLIGAMRQPVFKIWGHALGRLVQRRDPIDCDLARVLDAAAESRAAIEINGDPYRLDLPPEHVRDARRRGLRFVVSTDAHSTRGMHNLRFGVAMARRGGVRRQEVLNTLGADAFAEAVRPQ